MQLNDYLRCPSGRASAEGGGVGEGPRGHRAGPDTVPHGLSTVRSVALLSQ